MTAEIAWKPCPGRCLLCGDGPLRGLDPGHSLQGVTSDCKPWPRMGTFLQCERCGHLQKRLDEEWRAELERVYAQYEMYPLSDGKEQVLFDEGVSLPRSERVLACLEEHAALQADGCMLDLGCGNGSALRSFHRLYPRWRLSGFEQNDRYRAQVEALPGVVRFSSGSLEKVPDQFDLVTMLYVVEHLAEPVEVLKEVRRLLKPGGRCLLQTSNVAENPFDLAVVDHCSHFVPETLARLLRRAGFEVEVLSDRWVAKEIGTVARPAAAASPVFGEPNFARQLADGALCRFRWLLQLVERARAAGQASGLGIFGTAIAGTWLGGALSGTARFFVDEDPQREGKTHLGLPVFHPRNAPRGVPVCLAFPPAAARRLYERLQPLYPERDFVILPEVEGGV